MNWRLSFQLDDVVNLPNATLTDAFVATLTMGNMHVYPG